MKNFFSLYFILFAYTFICASPINKIRAVPLFKIVKTTRLSLLERIDTSRKNIGSSIAEKQESLERLIHQNKFEEAYQFMKEQQQTVYPFADNIIDLLKTKLSQLYTQLEYQIQQEQYGIIPKLAKSELDAFNKDINFIMRSLNYARAYLYEKSTKNTNNFPDITADTPGC
jgi:hypothetical protein